MFIVIDTNILLHGTPSLSSPFKEVILYSSLVIDKLVHIEFTLQKDVNFH